MTFSSMTFNTVTSRKLVNILWPLGSLPTCRELYLGPGTMKSFVSRQLEAIGEPFKRSNSTTDPGGLPFLRRKFLGALRGGVSDSARPTSCLYYPKASVVKYLLEHWRLQGLEDKEKAFKCLLRSF